jgi:hypothetical protein
MIADERFPLGNFHWGISIGELKMEGMVAIKFYGSKRARGDVAARPVELAHRREDQLICLADQFLHDGIHILGKRAL